MKVQYDGLSELSNRVTTLDALPIWGFFCVTVLVAYGCVEIGIFWSKRSKAAERNSEAALGSIVGATLALLAFMLAFTFQMAAARFDARRLLVVKDANAIGTCYLRAGYLEEPSKTKVRKVLKDYVALRLQPSAHIHDVDGLLLKIDALQNELWNETEVVATKHPNLPAYAIFITSVNDVIDTHAERVAAGLDARVPMPVWLVMFVVTVFAMVGTGYFCGSSGSRNSPESLLMMLAFSIVLMLVVDLDRPWEGSIATPQTPMLNLAKQLGVSQSR
jgi:hypothetical protein